MARMSEIVHRSDLPNEDSEVILPDGEYVGTIERTDYKQNASGTGSFILLSFKIESKGYEGLHVTDFINYEHINGETELFARKKLNSLLEKTGVESFLDTDDLLGLSVGFRVEVREDGKGVKRNNIRAYIRRESATGAPPPPKSRDSLPRPNGSSPSGDGIPF